MGTFANTNVPSIWDRADGGVTTNYGTATPTTVGAGGVGLNNVQGPTWLEEYSDSPTIEFAEQCTITHKFNCDRLTAKNLQIYYPRGTLLYDNSSGPFGPNVSRVLSTTAKPIAKSGGNAWELTMTSEAQSFAAPYDEFDIDIVELNPPAEKHPRYSALSYSDRNLVRQAFVSDYIDVKQTFINQISQLAQSPNQWANEQGQALELLYKKQKGEDSFYLSGYRINYSRYFWAPQDINPGGYTEDPFSVIPYQYWTDVNGLNIFRNTAQYNYNLYPNNTSLVGPPYGLSWLRQTDTLHLNRTWYKLTMSWIGAPLGVWDNEWYNPVLQPLQTTGSAGGIVLSS